MRPPHGRRHGPDDDWRPTYEWHTPVSDAWVFGEAVITILTALLTIIYLILRHPFTVLTLCLLVAFVGAVAGWW